MLNLTLIGVIYEPNPVLVAAMSGGADRFLGTETAGGKEFIATEDGMNIALEGDAA